MRSAAVPSSLVHGDIRDQELMATLVKAADIVFHQAALRITHCAAEPRLAMEVMVQSTYDLLELCVKHGVEKVIAASSASVYGLAAEFPTTEHQNPYDNRTLYGAAKAFNEGLLRSFNDMYGLDYVAFRYFNVYGDRMDIHGRYTEVLVRWMERLDAGQAPIIFGDGKQTMDFVHVRDIARANILGAKAKASDEVFNVASGTETSLAQLAEALTVVMGRPHLTPEFAPERSVNPVPRRLAATDKAERMLGFRTTVPLSEGLRDLVAWWRAERAGRGRAAPAGGARIVTAVLLVGASGLAREVIPVLREAGREILGVLDDRHAELPRTVGGVPVLGGIDDAGLHPDADVLVCIGPGPRAHQDRRADGGARRRRVTLHDRRRPVGAQPGALPRGGRIDPARGRDDHRRRRRGRACRGHAQRGDHPRLPGRRFCDLRRGRRPGRRRAGGPGGVPRHEFFGTSRALDRCRGYSGHGCGGAARCARPRNLGRGSGA